MFSRRLKVGVFNEGFLTRPSPQSNRVENLSRALSEFCKISVVQSSTCAQFSTSSRCYRLFCGVFSILHLQRQFLCIVNIFYFWLKNCDLVYVYGSRFSKVMPIVLFCRLLNFKVMTDITELPDYLKFEPFYSRLAYMDLLFGYYFIPVMTNTQIAISTRILRDMPSHKTILIPSVENEINKSVESRVTHNDGVLRFLYIGKGMYRDMLRYTLDLFLHLSSHKTNLEFHFVGDYSKSRDFQKFFSSLNDYSNHTSNNFIFHGRVHDEKLAELFKTVDFGILLRQDRDIEAACFPTRLAEFSKYNIPVVTTPVGDVTKYFVHNDSTIFISGYDLSQDARVLTELLDDPFLTYRLSSGVSRVFQKHLKATLYAGKLVRYWDAV